MHLKSKMQHLGPVCASARGGSDEPINSHGGILKFPFPALHVGGGERLEIAPTCIFRENISEQDSPDALTRRTA